MKTLVAVDSRLERLAAIADEFEDRALAAEARAERQRLQQARFFVACVGQFKRGKSTLINALVGAPVLPVGVVPVTSVVTILSFADAPRATVRLTNGRSQGVALDTIADFIDERRNPDNRRGAAIVEVGLPSTLLRNGLCLVDTPGIGSIHATNTEATRAFLPRIDVALAIVGPDPPIAGAELSMLLDADREAGELALVLNKSDQVSASSLAEVTEFTCTAVASASGRAVEHFFAISALERLTTNAPTRDWSALESFLDRLSLTARDRLVERAADRSVARVAGRLVSQISQREEALQSPLDQIEQQAARLQQAVTDVDQAILELRFRFDAAETDLGTRFEEQRRRFIATTTSLTQELRSWITAQAHAGSLRRVLAFEEARRLATSAIQRWFDAMDPEANRLYQQTTRRFLDAANEYVARVASDAADLGIDEMPDDAGLQLRRQFYLTHLMHTTGGTPITWAVDHAAPPRLRQTHVGRAATAYLARLLESNSHRVENDFKDRTRESRRWLEAQIRKRLATAVHAAERALALAREKRHMSEADVSVTLQRLDNLRDEVTALGG
jgi:dynamin family protein